MSQHLEGKREQRIARQNGHGVAEDFVVGGLAAPVVVVVECREIVVDQGIGVDHFERARRGEDARALGRDCARRLDTKNRPDALTAREEAVAHGAMDGCRCGVFRRDQAIEFRIDQSLLLGEVFAQIHGS